MAVVSGVVVATCTRCCKPGDSITDVLKLRDTVLEIDNKSLTHRPDLWGHYGFAREIAALTGRPLRPLEMSELEDLMSADVVVPVAVDDPEKCYRYCAVGIEGVDTRPSPGWLQTRLAYVGMRPINFIVDLTNYIMLELGQPMHAFDSNMIQAIRVMTFGQVKAAGYSGIYVYHSGRRRARHARYSSDDMQPLRTSRDSWRNGRRKL